MNTASTLTQENGIARISLHSGRGNPIRPVLLDELHAHLDALNDDLPRVLVLDAGDAPIFSGGFDLPMIAGWSREQIGSFFGRFNDVLTRILQLPCPSIAAVGGHAIAGGFILSLACDLRVVRNGPLKLGLSEVKLGVAVPAGTLALLTARTSPQAALKISLLASLIGPEEAQRIGYADAVVDDPIAHAMQLAGKLAALPGPGVGITHTFGATPILQAIEKADAYGMEAFLDTWFSPEGQACIHAMAKKLSGKG